MEDIITSVLDFISKYSDIVLSFIRALLEYLGAGA